MFAIKARIVEDIEVLKHISLEEFEVEYRDFDGFFALNFNGNWIGYYHEGELRENEMGWEWILMWFDFLLDVEAILQKDSYALLKVSDTLKSWIEFVKEEDNLKISLVEYMNEGISLIYTQPPVGIEYEWKDVYISKKDFVFELIGAGKKFVSEVEELNPVLLKSRGITNLIERLSNLS